MFIIKRKITATIILMAAILSILSGCSDNSGKDANLSYPIDAEPFCLDPQVATDTASKIIINNCMEGLLRIDEKGEIQSGVAESWDVSSDGLTYTFKLRKNAKWHLAWDKDDGVLPENFDATLTANDFVFAFRRVLSPSTNSPYAQTMYAIKNAVSVHEGSISPTELGVTATDSHTLTIRLVRKDDEFIQTLTTPAAMPCNEAFFNNTKGRYGLGEDYTLCNGPFYLSKWTKDTSVLVRRNPDYLGENQVLPASVSFYVNANADSRLDKLETGDYSASPLTSAQVSKLGKTKLTVEEFPNTVWGLLFHCSDSSVSNTNIRLAFIKTLNTSGMQKSDYMSGNALGIVPPTCSLTGSPYRSIAGNAEFISYNAADAAKKWQTGLEELGVSSLNLTLLCSKEHEIGLRTILQSWQKNLGISLTIKIVPLEREELEKRVSSGNYQLAFAPIAADERLAVDFLQRFTSNSPKNVVKFNSSAYDKIISQLRSVSNSADLIAGCRQAEMHLLQNAVIYPLYTESSYFAFSEKISGLYLLPGGENISFINTIKKD